MLGMWVSKDWECCRLGRKQRTWEATFIMRSITLSSWFLLKNIIHPTHEGHYGWMFQMSLVLLLVFVVFGPLWSCLLLPPLADVPCESSQLLFCFSFFLSLLLICALLKLISLLFSCLFPCRSPSAFPGDLPVSAPRCPSKWQHRPAGL